MHVDSITLELSFQGDWVPGIMYYMVAVLSFLSIVGLTFLPETMNCTLVDKMSDDFEKRRRREQTGHELEAII